MANCPVCSSKDADVSSARRIPGRADAKWYVKCRKCPVPFEILGSAWNLSVTNPRELERRRPQWTELLRAARERGDSFTTLY